MNSLSLYPPTNYYTSTNQKQYYPQHQLYPSLNPKNNGGAMVYNQQQLQQNVPTTNNIAGARNPIPINNIATINNNNNSVTFQDSQYNNNNNNNNNQINSNCNTNQQYLSKNYIHNPSIYFNQNICSNQLFNMLTQYSNSSLSIINNKHKLQFNKNGEPKLIPSQRDKTYIHPKSASLETWNFSGESTTKIYQSLNKRSEFHKSTAHSRVAFVKKVFSWLAVHDRDYLMSHKTIDLVTAISDILNMIISLIELHRGPSFLIYLIIFSADRFVERTGINHHQIFNLLLTSSIVNLKFWNESLYIQNKTIANIFSFNVKDLNTMERRFLFGLDYNLCVSDIQLESYIQQIKFQSLSSISPLIGKNKD